ncbi:MAG: hypothetical protein H6618_04120 [Deltaproteobacteria bacterium]|nr:hypothetical protein [Deltaproteobacteria bacterium]
MKCFSFHSLFMVMLFLSFGNSERIQAAEDGEFLESQFLTEPRFFWVSSQEVVPIDYSSCSLRRLHPAVSDSVACRESCSGSSADDSSVPSSVFFGSAETVPLDYSSCSFRTHPADPDPYFRIICSGTSANYGTSGSDRCDLPDTEEDPSFSWLDCLRVLCCK